VLTTHYCLVKIAKQRLVRASALHYHHAVADFPRTRSGKLSESAVREMVNGREVKNRDALANPEVLVLFRPAFA
jgi:acetoacetyl-CoA synthetase